MSRRIEVELTSARDDGTWTWRAAGARQPKGVLDGALLYEGAKVGDVVRADADFDIDGITVTAVLPPKGQRREPERLEVLGPQRDFTPVTSTLARRERGDRGGDRPRRDRDRRPGGPRPDRGRRDDAGGRRERRDDRPRRERPAPPPPRPKAKKLRPRRTHRDAFLASLPPEQQPIAEQALRGGMPAVRTALHEQNTRAKAEGKPEVPVPAVLAIAEEILPAVRLAEWLDRAEAALADAEELALQDLRSVVVSANDIARDQRAQEMANQLRAVLDRRGPAEQEQWRSDVEQSLAAGRVVRALRLAARPPQPNETLPEELSTRLAEAAGKAMTAEIEPSRWATVLDAVAYSPLRRTVVPAGVPAEPGDELLALVRKHAGRSPAIAALFGIEAPAREARRGRRGGSRPAGGAPAPGSGERPAPPRAPAPEEASGAATEAGASPDTPDQPAVTASAAVAEEAPASQESSAEPAPPADVPEELAPLAQPSGDSPSPADPPAGDPTGPQVPAPNGAAAPSTEAQPGGDDPRPQGDAVLAPHGPAGDTGEGAGSGAGGAEPSQADEPNQPTA